MDRQTSLKKTRFEPVSKHLSEESKRGDEKRNKKRRGKNRKEEEMRREGKGERKP